MTDQGQQAFKDQIHQYAGDRFTVEPSGAVKIIQQTENGETCVYLTFKALCELYIAAKEVKSEH